MDTQPIPTPTEKLDLKREETKDLRIYFFIARTPEIKVEQEKCVAVLAYDLENALIRASQEAKGLGIVFHGQSSTVKELIEKIYLEGVISPPTTEVIEPVIKEKLSLEQFKSGLLMILEEYVKDEKEKVELKTIIEKLK